MIMQNLTYFHIGQKGSNFINSDFYLLILNCFVFCVQNEPTAGNALNSHKITHKAKSPTVVRTEGVQIPIGDSDGGEEGIRTLVGFPPNGFQDRLVMTTSILLRLDVRD